VKQQEDSPLTIWTNLMGG